MQPPQHPYRCRSVDDVPLDNYEYAANPVTGNRLHPQERVHNYKDSFLRTNSTVDNNATIVRQPPPPPPPGRRGVASFHSTSSNKTNSNGAPSILRSGRSTANIPQNDRASIASESDAQQQQQQQRGNRGNCVFVVVNIIAPAGKLGLKVDSIVTRSGGDEKEEGASSAMSACIIQVKDDSPLRGKVQLGDTIVGVDDDDVSTLNSVQISMLLGGKSRNSRRKITVLRNIAPFWSGTTMGSDGRCIQPDENSSACSGFDNGKVNGRVNGNGSITSAPARLHHRSDRSNASDNSSPRLPSLPSADNRSLPGGVAPSGEDSTNSTQRQVREDQGPEKVQKVREEGQRQGDEADDGATEPRDETDDDDGKVIDSSLRSGLQEGDGGIAINNMIEGMYSFLGELQGKTEDTVQGPNGNAGGSLDGSLDGDDRRTTDPRIADAIAIDVRRREKKVSGGGSYLTASTASSSGVSGPSGDVRSCPSRSERRCGSESDPMLGTSELGNEDPPGVYDLEPGGVAESSLSKPQHGSRTRGRREASATLESHSSNSKRGRRDSSLPRQTGSSRARRSSSVDILTSRCAPGLSSSPSSPSSPSRNTSTNTVTNGHPFESTSRSDKTRESEESSGFDASKSSLLSSNGSRMNRLDSSSPQRSIARGRNRSITNRPGHNHNDSNSSNIIMERLYSSSPQRPTTRKGRRARSVDALRDIYTLDSGGSPSCSPNLDWDGANVSSLLQHHSTSSGRRAQSVLKYAPKSSLLPPPKSNTTKLEIMELYSSQYPTFDGGRRAPSQIVATKRHTPNTSLALSSQSSTSNQRETLNSSLSQHPTITDKSRSTPPEVIGSNRYAPESSSPSSSNSNNSSSIKSERLRASASQHVTAHGRNRSTPKPSSHGGIESSNSTKTELMHPSSPQRITNRYTRKSSAPTSLPSNNSNKMEMSDSSSLSRYSAATRDRDRCVSSEVDAANIYAPQSSLLPPRNEIYETMGSTAAGIDYHSSYSHAREPSLDALYTRTHVSRGENGFDWDSRTNNETTPSITMSSLKQQQYYSPPQRSYPHPKHSNSFHGYAKPAPANKNGNTEFASLEHQHRVAATISTAINNGPSSLQDWRKYATSSPTASALKNDHSDEWMTGNLTPGGLKNNHSSKKGRRTRSKAALLTELNGDCYHPSSEMGSFQESLGTNKGGKGKGHQGRIRSIASPTPSFQDRMEDATSPLTTSTLQNDHSVEWRTRNLTPGGLKNKHRSKKSGRARSTASLPHDLNGDRHYPSPEMGAVKDPSGANKDGNGKGHRRRLRNIASSLSRFAGRH